MIQFQKSKLCEDYIKIVYRAGMLAKVMNGNRNEIKGTMVPGTNWGAPFSVAKATLESQMSICLSVCMSVHQSQKPHSLSELLPLTIEPIDNTAYRPSSLLTIKPIDHIAYWPPSLTTI